MFVYLFQLLYIVFVLVVFCFCQTVKQLNELVKERILSFYNRISTDINEFEPCILTIPFNALMLQGIAYLLTQI